MFLRAQPMPRLTTPTITALGLDLPIHFHSGPPESPTQASLSPFKKEKIYNRHSTNYRSSSKSETSNSALKHLVKFRTRKTRKANHVMPKQSNYLKLEVHLHLI